MQALAARAVAYGVALLEDLEVGDTGVGHVLRHELAYRTLMSSQTRVFHRMRCRHPPPRRPCTTPPADRLAVHERKSRKGIARLRLLAAVHLYAVHTALAGGTRLERLEHDVRQPLAGQRVACVDGCTAGRRQHGVWRDDDVDRAETVLVQVDLLIDHRPQCVDNRRVDQAGWRVAVAVRLQVGPREVKVGASCFAVNAHFEMDLCAIVKIVDCPEWLAAFFGDHLEIVARCHLGGLLDGRHVALDDARAVFGEQSLDQQRAALVGRNLRLEVRQVVVNAVGADGAGVLGWVVDQDLRNSCRGQHRGRSNTVLDVDRHSHSSSNALPTLA